MLYLRHRKVGGCSETLGCALGTLDVATDVSITPARRTIVGTGRGVNTIPMPDGLEKVCRRFPVDRGSLLPLRCVAISKACCCLHPRVQDAAIQRDPTSHSQYRMLPSSVIRLPILTLRYQHEQTQSTITPPRADFSGPMHPKLPSSQAPKLRYWQLLLHPVRLKKRV
jgi:hypothetical protein